MLKRREFKLLATPVLVFGTIVPLANTVVVRDITSQLFLRMAGSGFLADVFGGSHAIGFPETLGKVI